MGRYERNFPAITEAEQEKLKNSRVFVAGCGGLGGYILEFLVRIGIGHITACDGDVFAPSNLNRQLLSTVPLLGVSKAKDVGSEQPTCETPSDEVFERNRGILAAMGLRVEVMGHEKEDE